MTRKLGKLEAALLTEGHERVRQNINTQALISKGTFDAKLRHHYGNLEIPYAVARILCCKGGTDKYLAIFFGSRRARDITVGQVLDTMDVTLYIKGGYSSGKVRYLRGSYIYDAIILAILWEEVQYLCPSAPTQADCVRASLRLANECDKLIALLTEV